MLALRDKRGSSPPALKRRRKSRWHPEPAPVVPLPGTTNFIPSVITDDQIDIIVFRIRIDEITRKLNGGVVEVDYSDDRSPSPEPIYDQRGKRLNKREQRVKDKLSQERQRLVDEAIKMNPAFKPPSDYKPGDRKVSRKIYIPISDNPEYNFIGLIIGPRGHTQKRMERESGARIAIRGKGSVKEGKNRRDVKSIESEHEDLHVLVTADSNESLEKACSMIRRLLVPVDETLNEHKKKQLRELAEINGTVRSGGWDQTPRSFEPANVTCGLCGDHGHPSNDCPLRGKNMGAQRKAKIDQEYEAFLAEIEGGGSGSGGATQNAEAAYEQFMSEIDANPAASNANVQQNIIYPPVPAYPYFQQPSWIPSQVQPGVAYSDYAPWTTNSTAHEQ